MNGLTLKRWSGRLINMSKYIREEWVKQTEFHPVTSEKVIEQVVVRTKAVLKEGKLPVVVFDLDSTLFDVSHRTFAILQEWINEGLTEVQLPEPHQTMSKLKDLKISEMKYSLQDVWEGRGIPFENEPFGTHFKHARNYWRKRFFNNAHLAHDLPTEGAVDFVKLLYELGAKIVYLTGRDIPLMGFGTFDQLKMHGLPIEVERTRLILKPKREVDDLIFKESIAKEIALMGEVVANFENEPKNLVVMAEVFGPKTMNIFIQSVSSDHPAPAGKGLYKINHFKGIG